MRRRSSTSLPADPPPTPPMDKTHRLRLRLFSSSSSSSSSPPHRALCPVFSASLILASLLCLYSTSRNSSSSVRYGIIIDGGSTGTRVHVFAYNARRRKGAIPAVDPGSTASMKASPGLSAYSADPEAAGESLVGLLEFARGRVPVDQRAETEVRLMATAGMRLLSVRLQEEILEVCRRVLRRSGFWFEDEWATVIPGTDEGIYAWVAANYALGSLGGDPQKTTGIIELGGASVQVTFVSSDPLPPEFLHVLEFGETTYNLYSQSFLNLGQNMAYESLREVLTSEYVKSAKSVNKEILRDPCTPKGYLLHGESLEFSADVLHSKTKHRHVVRAVGNFTECRSAALLLLHKEKDMCLYEECLVGSSFIPKLRGRFLATENFFYTSKFFGLGPTSFLSDLVLAGERFCGEDWTRLKKKYHQLEEKDLVQFCFSSAYIVTLLHDSLGFDMNDARIRFANQVGNTPLDWALGAFVMQKTSDPSTEGLDWSADILNDDSSTVLVLLIVISAVLVFAAWFVSRWRRSRLKTIYDMEKGRYIVKWINK